MSAAFRQCYSKLPEATLLVSAQGRILEANRAARELLGVPASLVFAGSTLGDLVQDPPEKVVRLLELCCRTRDLSPGALVFKNGSQGGIPCRVEGALFDPAPDGSLLLLRLFSKEESTRRFRALNERIDTLNREVTQRKRAEATLYAQREWLRATLVSIGDAVVATDAAGKVTLLNAVAESLTGWTQETAVGRPLDEIFVISNENTGAPVENPAHRVLREGRIAGLANHTRLTSKDGRHIPIDDSAAPLRDTEGSLTGVVLVFRDMTERKEAEKQLQASVERFRHLSDYSQAVMNNMAEGLYTVDTEGVVTFINPAAENMFGWTSAELLGKKMHDLTHYSHPDGSPFPASECPGLQVLQKGTRLREHEDAFIRRDGGFFPVVLSASPLITGGETVGVVVAFRDDTERQKAETERRAAETELRRANEDLNQFAFAASHDLQEPLRMITSYSQLLVKGYRGQFDDEASVCVRFITEGTQRMRGLLADLLAYTQVSGDEQRPPEAVDLNLIFQKTLENCRAAMEESQAMITSSPLPMVAGRESHFLQLLQNLVANAIKYRGDRAPRIHVSADYRGGRWRLAVSDNGIGIDPEYHLKIFGVFKRLHGKMIPGTGIGLAICQRVVERYGGRIWVESQVNQGATFYFTLPPAAGESA
jgi:PAS domain S-box-containing protein